jgi:hypothetical protein
MNMTRHALELACVAGLAVLTAACSDAACGDLLGDVGKRPPALEFETCRERPDLQGSPLEASYHVGGAEAAAVETYLVRELNVKGLQRTCCTWETTENSYRTADGQLFVISMATEETTVDARSRWPEIPDFYVTVQQFRDTP